MDEIIINTRIEAEKILSGKDITDKAVLKKAVYSLQNRTSINQKKARSIIDSVDRQMIKYPDDED